MTQLGSDAGCSKEFSKASGIKPAVASSHPTAEDQRRDKAGSRYRTGSYTHTLTNLLVIISHVSKRVFECVAICVLCVGVYCVCYLRCCWDKRGGCGTQLCVSSAAACGQAAPIFPLPGAAVCGFSPSFLRSDR